MHFRAFRVWIVIGWTLSLAGCLNPNFVRMPNLAASTPPADRTSLERFDPFPDEEAAPDTFTRPPSYVQQRTEARRSAQQRLLFGAPQSTAPSGPLLPSAAWRNSQVVRP